MYLYVYVCVWRVYDSCPRAYLFILKQTYTCTEATYIQSIIYMHIHIYIHTYIHIQGEDVVAGIRTPDPISTLADVMPNAYKELLANVERLEKHYHDMQVICYLCMHTCTLCLRIQGAACQREVIGEACYHVCVYVCMLRGPSTFLSYVLSLSHCSPTF
jgi:hypothetical protein